MGALEELGLYLASKGHGSVTSNPPSIVGGFSPPDPDAVLILWEYPGTAPQHTIGSRAWTMPRLQLICRDPDPASCATRMRAAFEDLDNIANEDIEGHHYLRVEAIQTPGFLRRDENERYEWVCNFMAWRS